jgi:hypothetical protein
VPVVAVRSRARPNFRSFPGSGRVRLGSLNRPSHPLL